MEKPVQLTNEEAEILYKHLKNIHYDRSSKVVASLIAKGMFEEKEGEFGIFLSEKGVKFLIRYISTK